MTRPAAPAQRPRAHALWLGLLLFAVYLLSFSGRFHVMDELAVFTVGHNLAVTASPDINQLIWTNHWTPHPPGVWGADDNLYTKKAPGVSLLVAALVLLARLWEGVSGVHAGLLVGALTIAATGGLLVVWLEDVGFSRPVALLTALGYGLCTFAWVYARMLWGLPVVGLLGLTMAWALFRGVRSPSRGWAWLLLAGVGAALSVAVRYESIYWAGFGMLYLAWLYGRRPRWALGRMALLLAPLAPVSLALIGYNLARFGGLGDTGYTDEIAFHLSFFSLYGLTFSPGQGLFTASPVLLLGFLGAAPLRRRLPPAYFWLIGGSGLGVWLFYSAWFAWGGVWNWGPRFLLTVLPLLMIFVAAALEKYGDRRRFWLLAGLLALLSVLFNLAGMATDFNTFFAAIESNRDFVLGWRHFPPLGNWRVFLAGGPIDLAWAAGSVGKIDWRWQAALPGLLLLLGAGVGLRLSLRRPRLGGWPLIAGGLALAFLLGGQALAAYSAIQQSRPDYRADAPLLAALAAEARAGDGLLITGPEYADYQELTTRLMAYGRAPLPVRFWIEGGERGIRDDERRRALAHAAGVSDRLWLLERLHSVADPLTPTVRWLEEERFLMEQRAIGESGQLSLYVQGDTPLATVPAGVAFAGGLTLESFAVPAAPVAAGAELPLRLHWRAAEAIPPEPITSFVHLLAESDLSQRVAESNRFLLDGRQAERSLLWVGQTAGMGHLLSLPGELPPGRYVLVAGLYRSESVTRLVRADNADDFVYLTTLEIIAPQ